MQKVRIPEALNVGNVKVKVEDKGLLLKEQAATSIFAQMAGVKSEAVLAFPNEAVSDADREVLTSEPIMQDIDKFFGVDAVKELVPEGHFMTFAMSYEYELID